LSTSIVTTCLAAAAHDIFAFEFARARREAIDDLAVDQDGDFGALSTSSGAIAASLSFPRPGSGGAMRTARDGSSMSTAHVRLPPPCQPSSS
jgi:hypothetical protein